MTSRWTMALAIVLSAAQAEAKEPSARRSAGERGNAESNRSAGEAFLAKNAARDGVVTLENGLQYRILQEGTGATPTVADTVVVHYRGSFVDGTEFGSSRRSGRPGTFPLRAAIAGWREGLQRMKTGSRWQLFVPPQLAYGAHGAGPIGPNATVIFEVELISVLGRDGPTGGVAGIEVSFKLDRRLTRSLYMGDRWVSPATFNAMPQGETTTVEASARAVDARGRTVAIEPEWRVGDPGMVEIRKGRGGEAAITVRRSGETTVELSAGGLTKKLGIRASERGKKLAVEISQ